MSVSESHFLPYFDPHFIYLTLLCFLVRRILFTYVELTYLFMYGDIVFENERCTRSLEVLTYALIIASFEMFIIKGSVHF